jgi:thiamine-phosphate pyrophosphorylase
MQAAPPRGPRPRLALPAGLYAILDADVAAARSGVEMARAVLAGGCRVIQLRMKGRASGAVLATARAIRDLAPAPELLLIVNDRVDVALAAGADGAHLGAEDLPVAAARRLVGRDLLLGCTAHSIEEALAAADAGADYVGFGPIFPTGTKALPIEPHGLDGLQRLCRRIPLPVVAIGGITEATAPAVREAGARGVALLGALARAEDPEATTRRLVRRLGGTPPGG